MDEADEEEEAAADAVEAAEDGGLPVRAWVRNCPGLVFCRKPILNHEKC